MSMDATLVGYYPAPPQTVLREIGGLISAGIFYTIYGTALVAGSVIWALPALAIGVVLGKATF